MATRGRPLPECTRSAVIRALRAGISHRKIAKNLDLAKRTVDRIAKAWNQSRLQSSPS